MNFHNRNISPATAVKMFGINYEGTTNIGFTALKRYSIEMRKHIIGFGGVHKNRIYTFKEIEVMRYIKRRTSEKVPLEIAAKDAVSVFYEIILAKT